MKTINVFLLLALASFGINGIGCTKAKSYQGVASLTIVNAVVGSSSLITNFNSPDNNKLIPNLQFYSTAQRIAFGGYTEFSAYSGETYISISQVSDTLKNIWQGLVQLPLESAFTLYLVGADTSHVDTLLTRDTPPFHSATDSSFGLRFINLSPESGAISVNLKGASIGSEVSGLNFKGQSAFKNYSATFSNSNYLFEIRDMTTGSLLATYTASGVNNGSGGNTANNLWRFRNFTILLKGLIGKQTASLINNF